MNGSEERRVNEVYRDVWTFRIYYGSPRGSTTQITRQDV